jgi:uncharacterized LabA/DUF88 family protein
MAKRACVFVDGENFRHTITDLFEEFDRAEYLPKSAQWSKLFDWFVNQVEPSAERVRAYWYVVQFMDFYPYKFPDAEREALKLKRLLSQHHPFADELEKLEGPRLGSRMREIVHTLSDRRTQMARRFDGWRSLHNGIATRHDAVEFRPSGGIRCSLFDNSLGQEKAVDVKLATDLIVLRDIYDIAVIVSGDQDYVPAVQVVKDAGKRVVNVTFETRGGQLLPGGARRLNEMTDSVLRVRYDEFKGFLF